VWSEVSLERAETMVFGRVVVQAFEVKNQSNLSRRGLCCLLDQVYLQPLSGSSTNHSLLMASLNANIS
jgi:hypothetical protein